MNDWIAVEKIAQWQKLKTLVLDSVSSPITKRVRKCDESLGAVLSCKHVVAVCLRSKRS